MRWRDWYERWERFQEAYVPHRREQLRLAADVAAFSAVTGAPRVLDLCAGPASAGHVVLDRAPAARVVAVDADPWLIELGRRARPEATIEWIAADVRDDDWVQEAADGGPFGTVVAATALHWLDRAELQALQRRVRSLLVPGGAFVIVDAIPRGTPRERAAALERLFRWQAARVAEGGEHWATFWRDARAEPEFAELLDARDARLGPRRPRVFTPYEDFEADLLTSGFSRVGELWRQHAAATLLAVA